MLYRDEKKCKAPNCHICQDNCPMGWIDLTGEEKRFGNEGFRCNDRHGCKFCSEVCSNGAVYSPGIEEVTEVMEGDAKQLFAMILKQAEERGEFRMVIPWESVGTKPADPNKHPKFIVPKDLYD